MVGLNVALTAINGFYIVRLLRGRHDSRRTHPGTEMSNARYRLSKRLRPELRLRAEGTETHNRRLHT